MRSSALLILLGCFLLFPVVAQEETDPATDETEPAATTEAVEDEDPADDPAEAPVVDDEFYQDAEDEDFRPSEDIPADQSIPFPTDI